MKLSQKLLALGGVTLADYACCPYDDYGMPHTLCTNALPEKTPFSLANDWRNGACKAWESNVDATYDGNDNNCGTNENWGSCGFQRHFPWNNIDTEVFRNRGCTVTYDEATAIYTPGPGCHCNNFADTETNVHSNNAIACKSTGMHAGSNDSPTSSGGACAGGTYAAGTVNANLSKNHEDMTASELASEDVCCDPLATDPALTNNQGARFDCYRDCTASDTADLATCYETDFLGRRYLQEKKLYIDDTLTYTDGSAGKLEFSYDADATSSTGTSPSVSNSKLYNLGGVPFLGGICKLFVPVPRTRITSVQIAGVHVSLQAQSVYSAKVDDDSSAAYDSGNGGDDVGTAYCFSVVNPAEGLKNRNGIHNGNVAGGTLGTATDPVVTNSIFNPMFMEGLTSLERQAGIDPVINFFDGSDAANIGQQLEEGLNGATTNSALNGEADSQVGANFDVVVHIHSEWCNSPSFWAVADMQLTGDYNNGINDYPLNSQPFTAQASRTDTKYSASQMGKLPIKIAFELIGTRDTEQAASEGLFTTERAADTCYAAATSCQTDIDDYFNAVKLAATCAADQTQSDCTTEDSNESAAKAAYYSCVNGLGALVGCTDDTDHFDEIEATAVFSSNWGTDVGEYNNAVYDYNTDLANSFTHAHMDIMDKRHNQVAKYNDVYQQDSGNPGYLRFPNSNDDAFTNIDGSTGTYTASASYLRWPNAGAFAAFYSFVACANPPHISGDASVKADVNYYSIIYNNAVDPNDVDDPPTEGQAYSYLGETILRQRTLVMSQSDSDYRDENCQEREFRGNVRQVGNTVTNCGPGQLPDTDNKRCTWNWNYNSHSYTTGGWNAPSPQSPLDAEEWFDRNDPHSFDMWSTRKRRGVANDRKYAFNMGYWGVQEDQQGTASAGFNGVAFDAENQDHANAIQIPITDFNFNLLFKNADDEVPPITVEINTDRCFDPSNADGCICTPSAQEFNLGGYVDNTEAAVTINAATYAADVLALPDLYHETACGGTDIVIGGTTYKTCDMAVMKDTSHLGQTTACDSNNGNSYKAASGKGGFRQLTNPQTLTFDDDRIKSALNPSSKKWEVSVQCQKVNMQTLSQTQAQRDFFPDCFFGDEIWFTFTYGSDLLGAYPNSPAISTPYNLSYNTYVSSWFSSVDAPVYDAQGVETTAVTQEYITASQLLTAN